MEMPSEWTRLRGLLKPAHEGYFSVTFHGGTIIPLIKGLDLMKEMAEQLDKYVDLANEHTHETCLILNKFSEWK